MSNFFSFIILPVILAIFFLMAVCDFFNEEQLKRQKIFDEAYDNEHEVDQFREDYIEIEARQAFNKRLGERKARVARRAGRRFRSGYLG